MTLILFIYLVYGIDVVRHLTVEKSCSSGTFLCPWRAVCEPEQGMWVWCAVGGVVSLWACFQAVPWVCLGRNMEDKLEEQCHK